MLSRSQGSIEMIPDREQLSLAGGKILSSNSANEWLDSRSQIDQSMMSSEKEERIYSPEVFDETLNQSPSNKSSNEAEDESEENLNDCQNKMAQIATTLLSHHLSTKQCSSVKTSSWEAKRAKVENIVTSIKDHPLKQQTIDLRRFKLVPPSNMDEQGTGSSPSDVLLNSRKRNAAGDYDSPQPGSPSFEKFFGFQRMNKESAREIERFYSKRQRFDEQSCQNEISESEIQTCENIAVSKMHENWSKKLLTSGFESSNTYEVLVNSLKRELLSDLDRIAENSAKRILDELRRTVDDFQSVEKNTMFWKFFEKKTPNSQKQEQVEKKFSDAWSERPRSNTSNASSKDGDLDAFQRKVLQEEKKAYDGAATKPRQSQDIDDQFRRKNNFEKFQAYSMERVSRDEKGEQVEALSLVKKKSSESSFSESDSSPASKSYSQNVPKHIADQFQKNLLNSISSSTNYKKSKISRTPSPLRQAPLSKPSKQSLLQDSNFYASTASSYRLPFSNSSILASSLQRDSLGSASLLRNPFSYNSSMYPSMVHPQNGFPFSAGHLPLPLLQTLQQQRNLAHALADYSKLNDVNELGIGRSSSTRTSTREPGFSSKHQEPKPDHIRYLNPSGLTLTQLSSSSAQDSLTPLHLKKAKIMFFYTRYPSANTLKTYFPDVKFTRATTSQLIKWFSNFREFFYIQIEKFARQAINDGVTNVEQLQVTRDSELFRVLNLHYNKCNDFRVPSEFLGVTLSSLEEFFSAIEQGKDEDPSWKKPIYKIICKLDQDIPSQFKSPNVLDRLSEIL